MRAGLIEGAAGGDKQQLRILLEHFQNSIDRLQQSTGSVASNTDTSAPVNPVPVAASLAVSKATTGWLSAAITNPQFLLSTTPGQKKGNLARSPMIHVVSYSTDPRFRSGVTSLPPSTQTHYQIPTSGQKLYFQVKSSADGVNYNQPQQSGPHTA